jgi:hypothetical protein
MTPSRTDLVELDAKLKTMLPEEYQECYEDVQPISMGSAGLKYRFRWPRSLERNLGKLLRLGHGGGPPHRGTLLEPATEAEIRGRSREIQVSWRTRSAVASAWCPTLRVDDAAPNPGWIDLFGPSTGMAGWMARAIVMENVSARAERQRRAASCGPRFRLEKEIKNVVTSVAKTAHYFVDHIWSGQQRAIAELFKKGLRWRLRCCNRRPRKQPAIDEAIRASRSRCMTTAKIRQTTGPCGAGGREYQGWLGLECVQRSHRDLDDARYWR